MKTTDNSILGVINPEELYTLTAFKRRLGVADATLRTARRAGLKVHYLHKQGFILGSDWIDYVVNSAPNASRGQVDSTSTAAQEAK
ncbi:hypothetical protein [Rhodopirellula bahusiensis]|uniref:Uncharacterized protein n=1 Tax=Rhodopirellula bahusiensis TaxID=2014065 RepID=A0A2G1W5S8_9BACT|nr:hypothetical protein [Rhodopirellula bahusiensis]PHQ34387.1 hypothetical protein CEE69_15325 [Rhodopirellula bahusiensis]